MRKQLMKCAHGRTMARGCSQCEPPQVTITGRAISAGSVTRASYGVSRSHNGRPLPTHLQCHPKSLTPTPRNPACYTHTSYAGLAARMREEHGTFWFLNGQGLNGSGRYQLGNLGFTDDPVYAKAWQIAANSHGINVEVIDNG